MEEAVMQRSDEVIFVGLSLTSYDIIIMLVWEIEIYNIVKLRHIFEYWTTLSELWVAVSFATEGTAGGENHNCPDPAPSIEVYLRDIHRISQSGYFPLMEITHYLLRLRENSERAIHRMIHLTRPEQDRAELRLGLSMWVVICGRALSVRIKWLDRMQ